MSQLQIKASDFNNREFQLRFDNLTSKTSLKKWNQCQIVEIDEKHVGFHAPKGTCTERHNLLMYLREVVPGLVNEILPDEEHLLEMTGKITEFSTSHNGMVLVQVELTQYPEKKWKAFLEDLGKLQVEMDKALKSMRD